jgi:hypothetical protein
VVILGVEVAGDGATFGRWDPEVGATSVKDNLKLLRGRTDGNLGKVCKCEYTELWVECKILH